MPGMNSPEGFHDRFLTQHNYQRYLLQLASSTVSSAGSSSG